ncbi:MICOS complex subunit MIC19 [Agrilus planipennis]|uniref:MICOS complex subunit MIC19 n=1 Tax=Agrilus planipennis TaxID=224129 RepID=A0A1W4WML9_AGRPL|nr:MICOS complex subunit MIC19 [Agrilus planipennis]
MGSASTKTRKLTIENEDSRNVIKVSDEVVQRLKGREEVRNLTPRSSVQVIPEGVPVYYYPEPVLTSLQCRQQKQNALEENDKYWERRIRDLQKGHDKMHEVMQCEYKKAIEEIQETKKTNKEVPCKENKLKVLDCYQKYPNEPMRCAQIVQDFADCVDSHRASRTSSKG